MPAISRSTTHQQPEMEIMNPTSSAVTGAVTGAAAAIAAVIDWAVNTLLHWDAPPQVVVALAAGVVTVGHLACNAMNARNVKNASGDATL